MQFFLKRKKYIIFLSVLHIDAKYVILPFLLFLFNINALLFILRSNSIKNEKLQF